MASTLNKKAIISLVIIFCMIFPLMAPCLAYAMPSGGVYVVDGQTYSMSVTPEENQLGLMVGARDIAEAFSLEYTFDDQNKAFEIYDDKHGTIVLMHNATSFYSGENIYDCQPYFYVRNGEPMVEAGFFCNMFESSYTFDKAENIITIDKDKISGDIAKVSYKGVVKPLYVEPVRTENGIDVRVADLAAVFGLSFEYSEENQVAVLNGEDGAFVELYNGATYFVSNFGEFECGAFFNVVNDIPMIDVAFFCDLYGASYEYDEKSKTLNIFDYITMEEKEADDAVELFGGGGDGTLFCDVYYPMGAPGDGLDVDIVLQQIGSRYQMYYGYTYYAGNAYTLGTASFDYGETVKYCEYDVTPYYSSSYDMYAVYYETADLPEYGFYNNNGATTEISYSPTKYVEYNSGARTFNYYSDPGVTIVIGDNYLSGCISLENGHTAPAVGVDVELILQTRSENYSNMYGASYYYVEDDYSLGYYTISAGQNKVCFEHEISDYFYDGFYYPYYSLYYSAYPDDCVYPYGYYNTYGDVTTIDSLPNTWQTCPYVSANLFDFKSVADVNIELPVKSGYSGSVSMVSPPVSSFKEGTYPWSFFMTLSTDTSGATIYYTTDGTEPTTSSKKYTGGFEVENDTIVKAFAVKPGMVDSSVNTYKYTINSDDDYFKFIIDEDYALLDGVEYAMDAAAVLIDGDIFVPIRAMCEAIEADCSWNSDTETVKFEREGKTAKYRLGDGNCCLINSFTYVKVKAVVGDLLGEYYDIVSTPLSITVKKSNIVEGWPTISISDDSGRAGDLVTVDVSIKDNPGIAGFALEVCFDNDVLIPVAVTQGSLLTSGSVLSNIDQGGDMSEYTEIYTSWSNPSNITGDGVLYSITFKIIDGTDECVVPFSMGYSAGDISNQSFDTINANLINGQIEVINIIKGDIFTDGVVNSKDAVKLSQYLARWNVNISDNELKAADVFADGVVNSKDAVKLSQYLARWNVSLD